MAIAIGRSTAATYQRPESAQSTWKGRFTSAATPEAPLARYVRIIAASAGQTVMSALAGRSLDSLAPVMVHARQ
jgi:hypothetical protein